MTEHDPKSCGCKYLGCDMWSCGHVDNQPAEFQGYGVFDCETHQQLSDRLYPTAEEANHDYHMNEGHTYINPVVS